MSSSTKSEQHSATATTGDALRDRLAGGPISWGVCEVPGWGAQLPPDRVLAEMRSVGLRFVEAGPVGYLGSDAATIRAVLSEHGHSLVGGFLPVVLHDPSRQDGTLASARATAALYAESGGRMLVSACVADERWSEPPQLDAAGWDALATGLQRLDGLAQEYGLVHVLHPHVGTLVETADDLGRLLEMSEVRLCLDTGHLTLGGADPMALVRDHHRRVAHVHLKDVREEIAKRLRTGDASLVEATRAGLFCPLGDGDAAVAETVRALEQAGYDGWYVLEQDAALSEDALPPPGTGPAEDARRSIEFLRSLMETERASTQKEAIA